MDTNLYSLNEAITNETARGKGGSRPPAKMVNTCFWSIRTNEELDINEKYLLLYLLTNEKTNLLGIYELPSVRCIAFDTGFTANQVHATLDSLKSYGIIDYSTNSNEVLLYGWLKYGIAAGGGSVCQRLLADAATVKDKILLKQLLRHCSDRYDRYSPTIRVFLTALEEWLQEQ